MCQKTGRLLQVYSSCIYDDVEWRPIYQNVRNIIWSVLFCRILPELNILCTSAMKSYNTVNNDSSFTCHSHLACSARYRISAKQCMPNQCMKTFSTLLGVKLSNWCFKFLPHFNIICTSAVKLCCATAQNAPKATGAKIQAKCRTFWPHQRKITVAGGQNVWVNLRVQPRTKPLIYF